MQKKSKYLTGDSCNVSNELVESVSKRSQGVYSEMWIVLAYRFHFECVPCIHRFKFWTFQMGWPLWWNEFIDQRISESKICQTWKKPCTGFQELNAIYGHDIYCKRNKTPSLMFWGAVKSIRNRVRENTKYCKLKRRKLIVP